MNNGGRGEVRRKVVGEVWRKKCGETHTHPATALDLRHEAVGPATAPAAGRVPDAHPVSHREHRRALLVLLLVVLVLLLVVLLLVLLLVLFLLFLLLLLFLIFLIFFILCSDRWFSACGGGSGGQDGQAVERQTRGQALRQDAPPEPLVRRTKLHGRGRGASFCLAFRLVVHYKRNVGAGLAKKKGGVSTAP